jgi:hypothetical protein
MKVLLSCDENPFYYDFWPSVRKMWKEHIGIEPKLVLINDYKETEDFEDDVLYIKQLPDFPVHLQSQMARIYFTQKYTDDICLVSDIDMFPISRSFFDIKKISNACDAETFFHLNPERREFGQFPLCYYCGYGSLYSKLIGDVSWEQFLQNIVNMNFNTDALGFSLPKHLQGKNLWFSDELFMFSSLQNTGTRIMINNELVGHRRVDREGIVNIDYLKLTNQDIVDIHLPRPYKDYERFIDNILFTFV